MTSVINEKSATDAYAAAVSIGGLPFLVGEELRGFSALRRCASAPSVPALLSLLEPPAEAFLLAPLPLPEYPPAAFFSTAPCAAVPLPRPPLAQFSARQPALLAGLTFAGAPPPCASSSPPLPLAHPLRHLRGGDGDGGGGWLDAGRGGPELREADAPGAPPWVAGVRAWAAQAAITLTLLNSALGAPPLSGGGARGAEWVPRAVLLLAPLCCAVSWSHPALAGAAAGALEALAGAAGCSGGGDGSGGGGAAPGEALAREHAPALLAAVARGVGGGGEGAPPSPGGGCGGGARFALPWLLRRLPPQALADALPAALAAAHRVCDDWDATSAWCGVSAVRALLEGVPLSLLAPWAGAAREVLTRAASGAKHPLVVACVAHARACALSAAPLEHSLAPLARLCSGGGGDAPLFDTPYDSAVAALLRDAALCSNGELLLAHVASLPPLLLAMGPWAARHAAGVAAVAARGVGGSGARAAGGALAAAALHALRAAVLASPAAFDGEVDAGRGDAPLLHDAVALCVRGVLQARAAEVEAAAEGGGEGGGGGRAASALVEAHACACLHELRAAAPPATTAALAAVEAGRDPRDGALAAALSALAAQL